MIDIEKFICSLMEQDKGAMHFGNIALKKQGFKYKDGAIVEIEPEQEAKFKVGDWITYRGCVHQITGVYDDGYTNDKQGFIPLKYQDEMRLWTIQDAKDGDVLADKGAIVLFKSIGNKDFNYVIDYYAYTSSVSGEFVAQKGGHYWGETYDCTLAPASKEQRERFFAAMRDAGYEWDAENKQLKKVEPKKELTEFECGYKQAIEDAVRYMDKVWGLNILGNSINDFRETMEQKLKELSQG